MSEQVLVADTGAGALLRPAGRPHGPPRHRPLRALGPQDHGHGAPARPHHHQGLAPRLRRPRPRALPGALDGLPHRPTRTPRSYGAGPRRTVDVRWGELDVLVIDTPPGTSDEHISVCEYLHTFDPDGALLVTTPQNVSVTDVKKELSFCHKIGLPVLGVVENMSGYVCPHCTTCTNIFSSEGGRLLAQEAGIPFVGKIPIAPALCECEERGVNPLTVPEAAASLAPLMEFAKSFLAAPERARKPAADAATATAASS
uniref:Cytosolic Fe-S cluster assembling factor Cfd1 n=1 Tax=Mastigamoeba balamuthi TaxID=108607 RepID=M9WNY2_MASBA|nr:cytosolic Fe-S cluster assembling factor Cfd1 [Mastigamoeba balamuthi]